MLPAGEDMHRGRVDLLHHAKAPAIDFRAGHRSVAKDNFTLGNLPFC